MIERIGDVVEIGDAVIALRGIVAVIDTAEQKMDPGGLFARYEQCTAIVIEGGQQINISREDGAAVRRYLKLYATEQAAQRLVR